MPETAMNHPSAELAEFAAQLNYEDIPPAVLRRTEDLMLDCLASILAGSSARPVQIMAQFADTMGPSSGPSENLVTRKTTSPLFAAMVNAAAAHMVEQRSEEHTSELQSLTRISYAVFCL